MTNEHLEDKIENMIEDMDKLPDKIKMTIKRCTPGKGEFGILGKDYDMELLINSEGRYMFTCVCGATSLGNAGDVNLENKYLRCKNYGICNMQIPGRHLFDDGPRVYAIKINK